MRRSVQMLTGILAAMTLGVLALGGSAWALPSGPFATASTPLSAPQGGTVTFSGTVPLDSRCPAGAAVQLTSTSASGGTNLFPSGLGPQVNRNTSGAFTVTYVIPASTPVGSYTVGLRCDGTTVGATEIVNVTAGSHVAPSIKVTPTSALPGATVTITGVAPTTGTVFCPSGDTTQLTSTAALFPPDGVGPQLQRSASGAFQATYVIPSTTSPGTYTVGVRCAGANLVTKTTLQVSAPATSTTAAPSTTTPATTSLTTAPAAAAPTTASSASTTVPGSTHGKKSHSPLRWVALGLLVVVFLGAVVLVIAKRDR
jgi:hypothetical protein